MFGHCRWSQIYSADTSLSKTAYVSSSNLMLKRQDNDPALFEVTLGVCACACCVFVGSDSRKTCKGKKEQEWRWVWYKPAGSTEALRACRAII